MRLSSISILLVFFRIALDMHLVADMLQYGVAPEHRKTLQT
jgi:hypothetical protein